MKLDSINKYAIRFEVLRGNAVFQEIYAVDNSVEVQFIESSELKTSFRGVFFSYSKDINFLSDKLRPIVTINDIDYPVGVYIITTDQFSQSAGLTTHQLEGYSLLYLAKQKKIEERLSFSAGENYITRIVMLLNQCGLSEIIADDSDLAFATDREDWEIGTPILDIVNELLREINYNEAWVDLYGTVRLNKYQRPSLSTIKHAYSAGEYSLIESNYTKSTDRYGKSNVFRVVCDSPDLSTPMVAISENNSENSPFSTVHIGRVLYTENVDNIPSQDALQAYADRLRDKSLQENEDIEFYTAPVPEHNAYDTVAIDNGDIAGIYTETEWRLQLSPGQSMYHKARRVYAE